jgi:oligopeptidase B
MHPRPVYLYGYGAYGYPLDAAFSASRMVLADRGFVVALAHVRGGGELGKAWHNGGRMKNKKNTFLDFVEVAGHLSKREDVDANRIVIEGGSAGGLLMGSVVNHSPQRWAGVLAQVPFVDVVHTMLNPSLPLTVGEYEEWGNPNRKGEFEWIWSYSPYNQLTEQKIPKMLVKTSLHDSQVMYWEPAKYVAKLRETQAGAPQLLFQCNMSAGHGGASGRYDALKERASELSFILGCVE